MTDRILMSTPDVGQLEEEYVLEAIRSGWVAPAGPDVDKFERELRDRIGTAYAVALSSGTAALHLSLLAHNIGIGDIVVTSSMTFAATTNAIVYTGATPYFVDSDPITGNISPKLVERVLRELEESGTPAAAVITVDLLGKAVDYDTLEGLCGDREIPLICDTAESLGASYRSKPTGAFGTASVFSFNGNKIMTTSGGGMLVTDNAEVAEKARYLSTQARSPAVHYEHVDVGYNYRLSNILAALGRAQLKRLDSMLDRRRRWRDNYREVVSSLPGVSIFGGEEDAEDNCWLTSIVIDPNISPVNSDTVRENMERVGIETRPLWKPMHLQPIFSHYPRCATGASEWFFSNGLTLPSGSAMQNQEFERVVDALSAAFAEPVR